MEPYVYCGKCFSCGVWRTNCCENLRVLGVLIDGGMCGYFNHPIKLAHKVPDRVLIEELAMIEPLVIPLHYMRVNMW